jgi:hypothetical protein
MHTELVALACTACDGSPTLITYKVEVSENEYDLGIHYDKAIDEAKDDGYEGPFVPFDNTEHDELLRGIAELTHMRLKL